MKYKIVSEDTIKNLIEFLDEVQFDAATDGRDKESVHKVNFCNWAINELLNSYDGYLKRDNRNKKSKDNYIEETLMDWNFPDMTEEEYDKLVDQFDAFFKGWKQETDEHKPKRKPKPNKSNIDRVVGHMPLNEIEEMLKDDESLTNEERMDLYYDEYLRVKKEKEEKRLARGAKPLDQVMKEIGLTFSDGSQTLSKKKK